MGTEAEIHIKVKWEGPGHPGIVSVEGCTETDLADWMMAAEFMMWHFATHISDLGYERAIKKLCDGADTYRECSHEPFEVVQGGAAGLECVDCPPDTEGPLYDNN